MRGGENEDGVLLWLRGLMFFALQEYKSPDSSPDVLEIDSKQSPRKKDSRTSVVTSTLKST